MAGGLHQDVKALVQQALYHNETYGAGATLYAALTVNTFATDLTQITGESLLWSNYTRIPIIVGVSAPADTMGAASGVNGSISNQLEVAFGACNENGPFDLNAAYFTDISTPSDSAYLVGGDVTSAPVQIVLHNVPTFPPGNITYQITNVA